MKDGDLLLEKLRQDAKRRNDIGLFVFAVKYEPPWWHWADYLKALKN